MERFFKNISVAGFLVLVMLLTGFTTGSQLKPDALPTRPPKPISGGRILLTISGYEQPTTLWTTVEWQNEHGDWYVVDGWRGTPDATAEVVWYVGSELIGDSTLFRWNVFDGEGGSWLATSESFTMPDRAQVMTEISVSLSD